MAASITFAPLREATEEVMEPSDLLGLVSGFAFGALLLFVALRLGRAEARLLRNRTINDPQAPPAVRDVRAFPRLALTTLWIGRDLALIAAAAAGSWLAGLPGALVFALAGCAGGLIGAARAASLDGPLRGRAWIWLNRLMPSVGLLRRLGRGLARLFTRRPIDAFIAGDAENFPGAPSELEPRERELLAKVRSFGSRQIRDVMTPRIDIFWLPEDIPTPELLRAIDKARFARVPIHGRETDDIVGILYAKDLVGKKLEQDFQFAKLLHRPTVMPPELPVDEAFDQLRRSKVHIALVVDELGSLAGLITLEDLLEEIFGEIRDESDPIERGIEQQGKSLLVPGRLTVAELATTLDRSIQSGGEDTTVSGLLMETAGKIPRVAEPLLIDGLRFTVEEREGTVLRRVRVEEAGK